MDNGQPDCVGAHFSPSRLLGLSTACCSMQAAMARLSAELCDVYDDYSAVLGDSYMHVEVFDRQTGHCRARGRGLVMQAVHDLLVKIAKLAAVQAITVMPDPVACRCQRCSVAVLDCGVRHG